MRLGTRKAMVLLTDGNATLPYDPNCDPCLPPVGYALQAAEDAKSNDVTIITLGVGSVEETTLQEVRPNLH